MPPPDSSSGTRSRQILAGGANGRHGVGEGEIRQDAAVLDHDEDGLCRSDLQGSGCLRHVGVPHDHVHAAVELGIAVGFVARVDHRARPRGGGRNGIPHLVGALGELVGDGAVVASTAI